MPEKRVRARAYWLLASSAALVASCSTQHNEGGTKREPFGFAEVRDMAAPIATTPAEEFPKLNERLRRDMPILAKLYGEALIRFEGIYGEGVGPASDKQDYLRCRAAFRTVAAQLKSPRPMIAEAETELWVALKACRAFAEQWSGPAEMATFGDDLRAMTDGAMIAYSYAVTAAGEPAGPQLYREVTEPNAR